MRPHIRFLIDKKACKKGVDYATHFGRMGDAWMASKDGSDMLWLAVRVKANLRKVMAANYKCIQVFSYILDRPIVHEIMEEVKAYAQGKSSLDKLKGLGNQAQAGWYHETPSEERDLVWIAMPFATMPQKLWEMALWGARAVAAHNHSDDRIEVAALGIMADICREDLSKTVLAKFKKLGI